MLYPINHINSKEGTAFWEDFLSKEDMQYILSMPEWFNVMQSRLGHGKILDGDEKFRQSYNSWMAPNQANMHIFEKISGVVSQVNARFFKFDLDGFYEPGQLTLYTSEKKSHYDWHVDLSYGNSKTVPRKLSMSLLLSDTSEFEGGELQVKSVCDEPQILEQKQGRAWFFPSYMLHRVTPVTKGIRRSLVFWIGGPEFR